MNTRRSFFKLFAAAIACLGFAPKMLAARVPITQAKWEEIKGLRIICIDGEWEITERAKEIFEWSGLWVDNFRMNKFIASKVSNPNVKRLFCFSPLRMGEETNYGMADLSWGEAYRP